MPSRKKKATQKSKFMDMNMVVFNRETDALILIQFFDFVLYIPQQTLNLCVIPTTPLPRIWYLKVVYEVCHFKQANWGGGAMEGG